MPNRYPAVRGHSLLVAKSHDESEEKSGPMENSRYLENIVEVCNKYHFSMGRNHARAGMSIPNHEHVHLLPRTVGSKVEGEFTIYAFSEMDLIPTNTNGVFDLSKTRFDTKAFLGGDNMQPLFRVIKKLESERIIFLLSYDASIKHQGAFYLTPCKSAHLQNEGSKLDSRVSGGPGYNVAIPQSEKFSYQKHIRFLEENIFLKKEFLWNRYREL